MTSAAPLWEPFHDNRVIEPSGHLDTDLHGLTVLHSRAVGGYHMFVRSIPLTYKSLPFPQEIFVLLVFLASWWCHFKNLTAKTPRAPRTPSKLVAAMPPQVLSFSSCSLLRENSAHFSQQSVIPSQPAAKSNCLSIYFPSTSSGSRCMTGGNRSQSRFFCGENRFADGAGIRVIRRRFAWDGMEKD